MLQAVTLRTEPVPYRPWRCHKSLPPLRASCVLDTQATSLGFLKSRHTSPRLAVLNQGPPPPAAVHNLASPI